METHVHTQAYRRMSSAGLFMISQNWKQAQDPSTETETRGASPHMMESEGMKTAPKSLGFPVCNLPIMQLLAAVTIGCCYKHLWHDTELLITPAVPGNAWVAAHGSRVVS